MRLAGGASGPIVMPAVEVAEQIPDLLLYLCVDRRPPGMPDLSEGRGVDRVGFIRLRAEELLAARGEMRAEWQLLDYEQRREWGSAAKATMPSLLVAVGLVPVRPEQEWKLAAQRLRGFQMPPPPVRSLIELRLHLYQARRLPGCPDTTVRLWFAGREVVSETAYDSSQPEWYTDPL